MKLKQILNENIEDEQAEANEKAVALLMMAQKVLDKKAFAAARKQWDAALESFSNGYEEDDDNQMYGGLDELISIGEELEEVMKQHYGDKFEATFKAMEERTGEFE